MNDKPVCLDHPSIPDSSIDDDQDDVVEAPSFFTCRCPHCQGDVVVPFDVIVALVDSFCGTNGIKESWSDVKEKHA